VTKEWVAIHRKHHAKCETPDDPHSPQTRGIKTVLLTGSELYRRKARNAKTLAKFGHGTPDDWIERNLYSRFSLAGVGLMLIVNLLVFGVIGATVWAVQMLWIPITAAGIVSGIGHWWGYRNFEPTDASRNILPWGLIIGGEELHNHHHTYPTSAKLSVKPHGFDIGWLCIRSLELLGLATVRKTVPQHRFGVVKAVADDKMLEAVIANRYEVMADCARSLRHASRAEVRRLKAEGSTAGCQSASVAH
jgi:stearoyl-CoA desaturase (delta-9 desaturase)